MPKRSLRSLLNEVDPNLNVVTGHHHRPTQQEWLAATGPVCSACKKEYLQGRDGMCLKCWEDKQDSTIQIDDRTGALEFFGDNILEKITHKSNNKR